MRTLLFVLCLVALFGCKDPGPPAVDPTQTPGYKMYGHIKPADFVGTWEYRVDRDDKEPYKRIVISEQQGKKLFTSRVRSFANNWYDDDQFLDQELHRFIDYLNSPSYLRFPQYEVSDHGGKSHELVYRNEAGTISLTLFGDKYLFKGK